MFLFHIAFHIETFGQDVIEDDATALGAGMEKTAVNLPTERSVIAVDPSEAVRSADILPVLAPWL